MHLDSDSSFQHYMVFSIIFQSTKCILARVGPAPTCCPNSWGNKLGQKKSGATDFLPQRVGANWGNGLAGGFERS